MLVNLPDLKPLPNALNLSKVPRPPKPPWPTALPPTEPRLPTPLNNLPAPYPPKAPDTAPFNPLPAATLVAAPIAPANTGPTPGIKFANGPAMGAIFFATFLRALPIFLKKNCSKPVTGFKLAIPDPTIACSGFISNSSNFFAKADSNCSSSKNSGGITISPGRKCASSVSPPSPYCFICSTSAAKGDSCIARPRSSIASSISFSSSVISLDTSSTIISISCSDTAPLLDSLNSSISLSEVAPGLKGKFCIKSRGSSAVGTAGAGRF